MKRKTNFRTDFNFKNGELFQRMDYLLKLGNAIYSTQPGLAKIYGSMMKDIAKRHALRVESKVKKLICEHCNNFLYLDKDTSIDLTSNL